MILELLFLCWAFNNICCFGIPSGRSIYHRTQINIDGDVISGVFSSKSCYQSLFAGSTPFQPWKRLWKTCAPPKCKFFLWLAMKNRCWTAHRLEKRDLPHPVVYPLCDQEQETIQHLLISCIFARQFWHSLLSPFDLSHLTPAVDAPSFAEWWKQVECHVAKSSRKGLNSVISWGCGVFGFIVIKWSSMGIPLRREGFREASLMNQFVGLWLVLRALDPWISRGL